MPHIYRVHRLKQNELNSTISVKMAEIRQLDIDIAALNTKVNSMEAELTSLRDQSSTRHKQYELDIAGLLTFVFSFLTMRESCECSIGSDIKFALTALTRAIDNMRGRHSVESALMELRYVKLINTSQTHRMFCLIYSVIIQVVRPHTFQGFVQGRRSSGTNRDLVLLDLTTKDN